MVAKGKGRSGAVAKGKGRGGKYEEEIEESNSDDSSSDESGVEVVEVKQPKKNPGGAEGDGNAKKVPKRRQVFEKLYKGVAIGVEGQTGLWQLDTKKEPGDTTDGETIVELEYQDDTAEKMKVKRSKLRPISGHKRKREPPKRFDRM